MVKKKSTAGSLAALGENHDDFAAGGQWEWPSILVGYEYIDAGQRVAQRVYARDKLLLFFT